MDEQKTNNKTSNNVARSPILDPKQTVIMIWVSKTKLLEMLKIQKLTLILQATTISYYGMN